MDSVKVVYGDLKITIRPINNRWWLDFYHNNKRIRRTTNLKTNEKNLIHIKTIIVPEIVSALTGNTKVEYFEKDLSFDEFSIEFFKVYKDTVRIHVYEKNQNHYNNHIKPYFAKHILKEIQPLELEQWQLKLLKKYKPSTVVKYRSIMYSIFDKALQNNLIKYNPLTRVKSPLTIKKRRLEH